MSLQPARPGGTATLEHLTKRIVEARAEYDATHDQWKAGSYANDDEETALYDRVKASRDALIKSLLEFHALASRELGIGG